MAATPSSLTELPYKVVGTFKDKHISPMLYPTTLHNIGQHYNEAYMFITEQSNLRMGIKKLEIIVTTPQG